MLRKAVAVLLMLCLLLPVPEGLAAVTQVEAPAGVNSQAGPEQLFDHDVNTKWNVKGKAGVPFVVRFSLDAPANVTGFYLATASSNALQPERMPRVLSLYGCAGNGLPPENSARWQVIVYRMALNLEAQNSVCYRYDLNAPTGEYQYFKLVLESEGSMLQLAEFALIRPGYTHFFAHAADTRSLIPADSASAQASATPTQTPTPTVRATATPKPTVQKTATPKPTAKKTATPKPTAKKTATPKPTATPTPTAKPAISADIPLTYVRGTAGVSDHEGPQSLVDGSIYSKWCTKNLSDPYVIFKAEKPVSVAGYVLVTAEDCSSWKGRNPYTWTLYGANGSSAPARNSDAWKKIDRRKKDTAMKDVNHHGYSFLLQKSSAKYEYFMFVVEKNHGATVLQLSELKLFAVDKSKTTTLLSTPGKGTAGVSANEGPDRLTDGSVGTKWCVKVKSKPYAIWQTNQAISVISYQLVTGDDTASYPKRNPVSWKLYACKSSKIPSRNSDKWKLIHKVTNSSELPSKNWTAATFKLKKPTAAYNCFMLVVTASAGADLIQLGEIVLSNAQLSSCIYFPEGSSGGGGGGGGGIFANTPRPWNRQQPRTRCHAIGCNGGKVTCRQCNGRGYRISYKSVPNYSGRGSTRVEVRDPCWACGNRGWNYCGTCGGDGWIND